jgi:hypothetical protein
MSALTLTHYRVSCPDCGESSTSYASPELVEQACEKWIDAHECPSPTGADT